MGSGLVVEDNWVRTVKLDDGFCNTDIGCPLARGAGIFVDIEQLDLPGNRVHLGEGAIFRNNWGKSYQGFGGAIFVLGQGHVVTAGNDLTIINNRIQGEVFGYGPGIYMERICNYFFCGTGSTFTVGDGLRVEYNTNYGQRGGGMYVSHSTFTAGANTSISHNRLLSSSRPLALDGAGVSGNMATLVFGDGLSIQNNTVIMASGFNREVYGGAMFLTASSFAAGDNLVMASNGVLGAPIYGHIALIERRSSFTAGDNLRVVNNDAPGSYGALYVAVDSRFKAGRYDWS